MLKKKLEQIKQNLPDDINIELIFTRATAIRNSYEGTIGSLIIGSILTVISVGIFCGIFEQL